MTSLKYLLDEGRIEAVEPDLDVATDKIEEAKRHLASAEQIANDDHEGAYSLVYDAARKPWMHTCLRTGIGQASQRKGSIFNRR